MIEWGTISSRQAETETRLRDLHSIKAYSKFADRAIE